MKIVGIKRVEYIRKSDNQKVSGYEFHYTYETKNISGVGVDTQYISDSIIEKECMGVIPEVGNEVDFTYNRYGRCTGYYIHE